MTHPGKHRFLAVSGMARGNLAERMEAMPDHLLCTMAGFVDYLYPFAKNPFFSLRHSASTFFIKRFLTGLPSADHFIRTNVPSPTVIPLSPRMQEVDRPKRLQVWAFLLQAGEGKETLLCCLYELYSRVKGTTELAFARLSPVPDKRQQIPPAAKPRERACQPATALQKGKQDRPAWRDKPPVWERLRKAGAQTYKLAGRVVQVAVNPIKHYVYIGSHNHDKEGGFRSSSLIRFTLQLPAPQEETAMSSESKRQVVEHPLTFPEPIILHADGKRELMAFMTVPSSGGVFVFERASSSKEDLAEAIRYFSGLCCRFGNEPHVAPGPQIDSSALVTTYSLEDYHDDNGKVKLFMGFTNGTALPFGEDPMRSVELESGFTYQIADPDIQFFPRQPITAVLCAKSWHFIFAGGQGKGRKRCEDRSRIDVYFPDTQGWGTIRHLWYLVPKKKAPAELLIGHASRPTESIAQGGREASVDHHFIIWDLSQLAPCRRDQIQASAREADAVVPTAICNPVYWFKDQLPERPDMPEHVRWDLACVKHPDNNRVLVGHLMYPL